MYNNKKQVTEWISIQERDIASMDENESAH